MAKYFLYARKSTESEDRQVLSIEAQIEEVRQYASKRGLVSSPSLLKQRLPKNLVDLFSMR